MAACNHAGVICFHTQQLINIVVTYDEGNLSIVCSADNVHKLCFSSGASISKYPTLSPQSTPQAMNDHWHGPAILMYCQKPLERKPDEL